MQRTISHLLNRIGPTNDLNDPLWTVRLCPLVCAFFFAISETVLRHGKIHPVVLAMGWVQLVSLSIAMFRARNIVCNSGIYGEHGLFRAIWTLRILPLLCAVVILAAEFVRTEGLHDALIGFATGLLCTILFTGFATTDVVSSKVQPCNDLQQLHLNS